MDFFSDETKEKRNGDDLKDAMLKDNLFSEAMETGCPASRQ